MKKYISLYLKLKEEIQSGAYKPNSRLPSKRTLSDLTGFSLTTVENAYLLLEDEGYIYSIEKKGYFVSELILPKTKEINERRLHLLPIDKSDQIKENLEYSTWFKTIRKVINDYGELLFIKSPQKGCQILRNAIAEYLLRYRKMFAEPSNIIIGSGAEQLYETAVMILGRDKIYGVENPCYSKITSVYESVGVKTEQLDMGNDGIKESELKNKNFDVLHVTPFHSFPSGVTTSLAKRVNYLNTIKQKKSYIIEDDYDSEFFQKGHPIDTLYSLSSTNSVIYINTFSKSLSSSMRMGYMIIPDSLMDIYKEKTKNISCTVPVLDQYILAEFIMSGNFERHLARTRKKLYL